MVLDWLKRSPTVYRVARATRLWAGSHLARPRTVVGVPGRVHPNDVMFVTGRGDRAQAYAVTGQQAMALLEDAVADVDRRVDEVRSWLDFGCGHGRVVRHLVQRVAPGTVWVADRDTEAVEFCVEEFGVHAAPAAEGQYQVVYAFSVLTHLPEVAGVDVIARLGSAVEPGGLLVLTTHGQTSLAWGPSFGRWCEPHLQAVRTELDAHGFAYRPYPHHRGDDYGLAWHSPAYVQETVQRIHGLAYRAVSVLPESYGGHQDTHVLQRLR